MHPLQAIMADAGAFVLIGDSASDRFPATSYNTYARAGRSFYCLDLGGSEHSRGFTRGGKVYARPQDIPDDRSDLAVIWVKPYRACEAVDIAHGLGCRRLWFSFQAGSEEALSRAAELQLQVVENGRCPVYYTKEAWGPCALHRLVVKATGTWARLPQTDMAPTRRELL